MSRAPRPPTKKDLEELVEKLRQDLNIITEERLAFSTDLDVAREKIVQLEVDLQAAQTQAQVAEATLAQAQAVAAAAAAAQPPAGNAANALVPKPPGVIRNLEELTGLTREDYKACQRSIRNIVVMAGLDVTQDFRRQNPEDLAKVYRAAREQHPVLRQFQNNWVTAELAKQFLQNRRKYAVRRGYITRGMLKTGPRRRRARSESVEI